MKMEELNDAVADGSIDEIIRVAEARQQKRLAAIADEICARPGVRLVLLSGGSSSGKTTTAARLCTQLRVNDRVALPISTDDYFVGDERNPRDAHGRLDYEHVNCVDIPALVRDLNHLFAGEAVPHRRFDFQNHVPTYAADMLHIPTDAIVVLEGTHALNPMLTEGVPNEWKFRLFINPEPSLVFPNGLVPSSSDARFLRRMVRDNHYRHLAPDKTLALWPNVLRGEEQWILPFRDTADARFDSYLVYELAVLKPFVGGLIARLYHARHGRGTELLNREVKFLLPVENVSADKVPGDSILRETIGGSQIDY